MEKWEEVKGELLKLDDTALAYVFRNLLQEEGPSKFSVEILLRVDFVQESLDTFITRAEALKEEED